MQTSMTHNRHLIIFTLLLAFLFTLFYIFRSTDQTPSFENGDSTRIALKKTICDKVDIGWLAGDRHYWDGWSDKTMFIKPDGTFTQGNVYINQGEEVCIVVLLGPIPAKKDDTTHTGPRDSIVMFANGSNSTKVTIQLQQDPHHSNAYFTAIKFRYPDTYHLNAINEYRSYFWESPVSHSYHPNSFESQNKLIVRPINTSIRAGLNQTLELCDLKSSTTEFKGAWLDKQVYGSRNSLQFFKAYENSEKMYTVNNKVFIADNCTLQYKSSGKGEQCLGKSNVHVFGDNNIRRNLKALRSRNNWCNIDQISKIKNKKEREEKMKCACNDDAEDTTGYPWVNNPYLPLILTNSWDVDSNVYFYSIQQTMVNNQPEISQSIKEFSANHTIPHADIVVLGLGNADIEAIQVSPNQFSTSFYQFLKHLRKNIYRKQKIIVKTPQYFCCGTIDATSWNTGRSLAFTIGVRNVVQSLNDDNVLLWDVHSLGTDETTCLSDSGSSYSKRNVINVENMLLWNLICEN
ncbi:hypothetical protein MFLAVUS_004801 [Mucor flavus]|uniref:Uncharacterized protein n=1 Tax=Mucor flavus TaxID=439312 RepID=A0ABP9YWZ4_9FUNG